MVIHPEATLGGLSPEYREYRLRPPRRKLPKVVALRIHHVCGPRVFALAALPELAIAARAALVLALALLRVLAPFCWVVLGRKCDTLDAGQAARAKPVPFWAPCPSSLTSSGDMEVVLFLRQFIFSKCVYVVKNFVKVCVPRT